MSYEQRCVAAVQLAGGGTDRCRREASNSDPMYLTLIPVCSWHIMQARSQFAHLLEAEIAGLKAAAAAHECDGDRAVAAYMEEYDGYLVARTTRWKESAVAYFIRCGKYIKIGASASPLHRLATIQHTGGVLTPDGLNLKDCELITTEPGGFDREKELHAQFAHLRHTGEWFTEAPELTEYIESLTERSAA